MNRWKVDGGKRKSKEKKNTRTLTMESNVFHVNSNLLGLFKSTNIFTTEQSTKKLGNNGSQKNCGDIIDSTWNSLCTVCSVCIVLDCTMCVCVCVCENEVVKSILIDRISVCFSIYNIAYHYKHAAIIVVIIFDFFFFRSFSSSFIFLIHLFGSYCSYCIYIYIYTLLHSS